MEKKKNKKQNGEFCFAEFVCGWIRSGVNRIRIDKKKETSFKFSKVFLIFPPNKEEIWIFLDVQIVLYSFCCKFYISPSIGFSVRVFMPWSNYLPKTELTLTWWDWRHRFRILYFIWCRISAVVVLKCGLHFVLFQLHCVWSLGGYSSSWLSSTISKLRLV